MHYPEQQTTHARVLVSHVVFCLGSSTFTQSRDDVHCLCTSGAAQAPIGRLAFCARAAYAHPPGTQLVLIVFARQLTLYAVPPSIICSLTPTMGCSPPAADACVRNFTSNRQSKNPV